MRKDKKRKDLFLGMRSRTLYHFEHQLIEELHLSQSRFHRVRSDQWKNIYQMITDKFADKTKVWKNGLHWANINGYSPKSMKKLIGCYPVNYQTWFFKLPQIIQDKDSMVYFLIDFGGDWYTGEYFWVFESYLSELVKVLSLLNKDNFIIHLTDYYIISKKYKWIIGFNHHDIASFVGEGIKPDCLKQL